MDTKSSAILCLAFIVFSSSAAAFDIVKLLEKQSDLTNFVTYLKETKLASEINSRNTVTVLAVSNGGISSLAGKSQDVVKKILSAHVVLDYLDEQKLTQLAKSSKVSTLTTLFQTSGLALNQQGFLNVGLINEGELAFGSAVKGSQLDAKLVKSLVSQPFNISVLQLSNVIEIPDIASASASSTAASPKASASTSRPAASPKASASSTAASPKASASSTAASPKASVSQSHAPSSSSDGKSPSPSPKSSKSNADKSSPPVPVDASSPSGDSTGSSSATPAPAPSAASRVQMAIGTGVMMGLASLLVA